MRILVTVGLAAALLSGGLVPAGPSFGERLPARPGTRDGGPVARADIATETSGAPVTYRAPLPTPLTVLRGFDPPRTRYGAGHLGVDLRVGPDGTVRAAGSGVVRFAGAVAGRGLVVIAHPDGISTEYEPIRPLAAAGNPVTVGTPIGVLRGSHRGCPGRCLHWGARRGDTYLDPLSLLRPLGPVRLLPWGRDP